MTPFPFSKSPITELPQSPPYYVSNFGYWSGVKQYDQAGIQFLSEFAKQSGLTKKASILEVGSGLGGSLLYWKHIFDAKKLSAINLPGEQSDFAKQLFHENEVKVDPFIEAGWEKMNTLPANTFDFVFSVDAAYHFENFEEFYHQAYRVLKPGGKLVFNIFHSDKNLGIPFPILLKLFLIPPTQMKTAYETEKVIDSIGFTIEKQLDWTIPVIEGFIQNSRQMKLSLRLFGFVLEKIKKVFGLTYHYYVLKK
ncbi:class I SAM-dependent methyltransferase [Leptospira levettii]|uniref:class I SAM-dependent methyltransferase n=1 Tax=Leptospira levettii TaxID=2023178 RepID=UPI000C298C5C|nr:class I SAM-dependent methyltransferase [Leptospira levettii]PKA27653.1 methyltransferase [Leptospira sp. mixed culture ATI2-C-A1]MCG6148085.1 class I SAM-dependent methyltransferase [Leptospira levettii]MCW7473478.1 class I SAM-dependent methyltransferase [Leptospira levettii]MCW7495298.1 class I SAM-dependent methyltransferase [Leptospira levettii]MCW7508131.1 class I SAM-dependent methyltransferase [Leptospira levettii]